MKKKIFFIPLLILFLPFAASFLINSLLRTPSFQEKLLAYIESSTGSHINAEALSVSLLPSAAIHLEGLFATGSWDGRIWEADTERLSLSIKPFSLLQGRLDVDSITLNHPRIAFSGRGSSPAGPGRKEAAGGDFLKGTAIRMGPAVPNDIRIRNGEFYWQRTKSDDFLRVLRVDADLRDMRERQIRINLKAAVLGSEEQNLGLQGKVLDWSIENLRIQTDWKTELKWNVARGPWRSDGEISGTLKALAFRPGGRLSGVEGHWTADLPVLKNDAANLLLEDLDFQLWMQDSSFRVTEAKGRIAGGVLEIEANGTNLFDDPQVHLTANLYGAELANLLKGGFGRDGRYRVSGQVQGSFEGDFNGFSYPSLISSLRGGGQVRLQEGRVSNFNILAKIVQKVAAFPVIGIDLSQRLSPYYRQFLNERDFRLHDVRSRYTIQNRTVQLPDFALQSDHMAVYGRGGFTLGAGIGIGAALYLSPELSYEMATQLPDLGALADPYGRLMFPFAIQGALAEPRIQIDKEYFTRILIKTKGQDFINQILEGKVPGAPGGTSAADLLKNLF